MKKTIAIFLLVIISKCIFGQPGDPAPGSPIPSFRIALANGIYYSNKDIPGSKPFVLIYFAPDCDHCTVLMDQLFKQIHALDKSSVVLVTFKPVADLVAFEKKYQTAKYKNITVGTEGISYVLRNYYRLDKTPFTAVYDKKGKLAFFYKNETPVNTMLERLKKL